MSALSLSSLSPSSIGSNIRDHRAMFRSPRRMDNVFRRMTFRDCKQRSETTEYLHWPFYLSRTRTISHEPSCRCAAWERAATNFNLRASFCNLALRRKIQLSITISQLFTGAVTLEHALIFRRIVPWSSPSFQLVRLYVDGNTLGSGAFFDELMRIFQAREASPYDRIQDGSTLLHMSRE